MCLTRRTFLRQSSSSLSAFSGVMPSLVYAGSRAEEGGEEVGGVDDAIVTERRAPACDVGVALAVSYADQKVGLFDQKF